MKLSTKIAALTLAGVSALGLAGCSTQADTINDNLSKDAEAFKLQRHITAINGITDSILLEVEGRCSLETSESFLAGAVEITCKIAEGDGPSSFVKNFVYLSDNVTFTVEQTEPVEADPFHYKWIVIPEQIIPDIEVQTSENTD